MRLSVDELTELADVAVRAATRAGEMIARSRPLDVQRKAGGASLASQVVTEIDRHSEDMILDVLGPTLEGFGLGLLTEEQDDDGGRLTADYFWCIDPLDGTLPFIEGVPGYAVSVALVDRKGTPWIGVVYDPVEATVRHAIKGLGAFRDGEVWSARRSSSESELTVFADRSFLAASDHHDVIAGFEAAASALGLDSTRFEATAGAVINAASVLDNAPACYVKFPKPSGGGSLWDFAATACLFGELGAIVTDIHGAPLELNRADSTFMNHRGVLFASDKAIAQRVRGLWTSRSQPPED